MLADMQREFRQWLVHADDEQLKQRLDSFQGLAAYQNNYRAQLVSALKASYPNLRIQMGEEEFLAASIHYIDGHPPSSWTLDHYGADFGKTLRAMYPDNPDLNELAWIEWALLEAFVADDAQNLDIHALTDIDWDSARLRVTPGFRQRAMITNVVAVWSALQDRAEPAEATVLDDTVGVMVWRQGFSSRLRQVDVTEYAAMQSLGDDDRFNAMCDAVVEHLGEAEGVTRAGSLLASWVTAGIVVGVDSHG